MRTTKNIYPTSYEDGSKWMEYEEDGYNRYVLLDASKGRYDYHRIAESQPPMKEFPDIDEAHDLVKNLYEQCMDNDMGYIDLDKESIEDYEEEYEKPWSQLLKELKEDVKKFKLENTVRKEDETYIAGYGELISLFKRKEMKA